MVRLSQRALAFAGFGALSLLAVIMFVVPPAQQYEMSIYTAYPWYFWTLLVASIVVGQVLVIRSGVSGERTDSFWVLGLVLTLCSNAILVFMPYIRGYPYFERADVLSHLGHIEVVRQTGVLDGRNIYPNIHQLVLSLSYATGLEPMRVISSVSGVFSLFSIVAAVALVMRVYDRQKAFMSLPFVCLLVGGTAHVNPSPFAQSVLLLPFVLYLFVVERSSHTLTTRIALVIVLVALTIYHPLTTVFLVLFLVVYTVVQFGPLRRWLVRPLESRFEHTGTGTVSRLVVGTALVWYYNFAGILVRANSVIEELLGSSDDASPLDSYSSTVSRTSPALIDVVEIAVLSYGLSIILLSIAGLHALRSVKQRFSRALQMNVFEVSFIGAFGVFSVLSVLFLVFDLIVGFGRPLFVARLFAVLVAGSFFIDLYRRSDESKRVLQAVVVVLALAVTLSVFTVHHSPLTIRENQQVTNAELDGAEWYLDETNQSMPALEYGIKMYRFEDALLGFQLSGRSEESTLPADHFGYDDGETMGAKYNESHYLVITSAGRLFYPEIWPDYERFWRYTPENFDQLERDPTVSHVYSNDDFDTYLVEGTNGTVDAGPVSRVGASSLRTS